MAHPILPPELEELIFSLAAHDDLKLAGRLVLVAKRVHKWVIPHIYNIVILRNAREDLVPHQNLSLDDLVKNGKHVRHLMVRRGAFGLKERFVGCVVRCPNLRSLALWTNTRETYLPEVVDCLLRLKLKYLSFDMGGFFGGLARQGRMLPDPFPTVTHLELIGMSKVNPYQVKAYFPALTHLAVISIGDIRISGLREVLDILGDRLEVLVCNLFESREDGGPSLPSLDRRADSIAEDDPRIVILWYGTDSVRTWYEGVRGGLGMWRIADEAVQARLARARTVAT